MFRSFSHRLIRSFRGIHLYLGVFTAPMFLFFAIAGGLQTLGLHENARGGSYSPPAWLASMAQLHKKQTMRMRSRRQQKNVAAAAPGIMAAAIMAGGGARALRRYRIGIAAQRPDPSRQQPVADEGVFRGGGAGFAGIGIDRSLHGLALRSAPTPVCDGAAGRDAVPVLLLLLPMDASGFA